MTRVSSVLLSILLLGSTVMASSKDGEGNPPIKPQSFLGTKFRPHWFVGAGVGVQAYYGDHNKQLSFGKRITPNFEIAAGNWFTGSFGVRGGVSGLNVKGLTQNKSHSTGKVFDASRSLEHQSFNYLYVHSDLLFNWTNDAYGYNSNRFYHLIPFAGVGVALGLDKPTSTYISPNVGVLQTFRLHDRLSFTIDVRANLLGDGFDGERGGKAFEGIGVTQFGLTYKLSK
ncbi:hypothetical protein [Sphingobacterium sp. SYP-B4668]|uniref:hypothetical protein n=1 Tax=Sphingobacterium sp. SYP-B4668 TaxID=2996035 RepID=UPI0022DD74E9|nr:hypothetical protein [Sphingobacterium sp. SYP-B4668]